MYRENDKIIVFKKAHELVLKVYEVTSLFPKDEQFGLISQIRRAAVSIPSNIAEGKARNSTKDYIRFLMISRGSLEELKYQMYLSYELEYLNDEEYNSIEKLTIEVGKLINSLITKLNTYL